MGKALYRKYRSKSLAEIVGQEHITTTLSNALKQGKISHAYLFTGPRGVGKTSIARILAHEVNGLPYDEETTHLDIIEIDAASNRRIDEIRELRDKVHTAPSSATYKVYIIDEVHMLTREAFNALLKTLEEPPAHAIFILATTDAHKVPETIISRTQRFAFRPIPIKQQVDHLRRIADLENIKIDDEALELIARHSSGSFRDSISLLDQARSTADKVSATTIQNILGIAPDEVIESLIHYIDSGTAADTLAYLDEIRMNGYHPGQLASQLSAAIRSRLIQSTDHQEKSKQTSLLYKLLAVSGSHDPMALLELILLEATVDNPQPNHIAVSEHQAVAAATPQQHENSIPKEPQASPAPKTDKDKVSMEKPQKQAATKPGATALDNDSWSKVLQAIKARHNTLYSLARMAVPSFNAQEVVLSFSFPFHQKRFNEPKTRQLITDIIYEQTGQSVTISCIVDPTHKATKTEENEKVNSDIISNISNIFGDAEVLE